MFCFRTRRIDPIVKNPGILPVQLCVIITRPGNRDNTQFLREIRIVINDDHMRMIGNHFEPINNGLENRAEIGLNIPSTINAIYKRWYLITSIEDKILRGVIQAAI